MRNALLALALTLPTLCPAGTIIMNPGTPSACVLTPDTTTLATVDTAGNITATGTLSGNCASTPPPPDTCKTLVNLPTGAQGQFWTRVTRANNVMFGDGTVATGRDPTDYGSQWTYPGNTPGWPGNKGMTTRPTGASPGQYFAEKFVAGTANTSQNWAWTGSGFNSNASIVISPCMGDFGQTGTQITTGCRVDMSKSSGGIRTVVNAVQQGSFCTLKPGGTYYLNLLPVAHLPDTLEGAAVPNCSSTPCSPWIGLN